MSNVMRRKEKKKQREGGSVGKVRMDRPFCKQCGKQLKRGQEKFCSMPCANKYHGKERTKQRKTSTCQYCKKEYIPKVVDRVTYCSRECCFKAKAQAKRKGKRILYGATCRVYFGQCVVCNKWFTARSKASKCCGNDCKKILVAPKHIQNKVGRIVKCKECGKEYVYQYGMKKRHFCSLACSKRANSRVDHAIRRARQKETQIKRIDPIAVFERDGWKCRICGKSTPRTSRGTYKSNAPELDHIVPLALGGWHTWQNVQCTCRSCNSKKGIKTIKK